MSSWYRFLLKCLVFIAIVLVVDFGMGKLFVFAKDTGLSKHPEDMWLKSSYTVEKVNSDVVIIGSSTATHHYIPSMIESETHLSTYNCGQDGCFFLYSACEINTILERYHPKVIVWDINPHSLLDTDNGDEYQNMRYLSYYYNNDTVIRNYVDNKESRIKYLYELNGYKYNSHFIYTFYPLVHTSNTQQGYIPLDVSERTVFCKTDVFWNGNWVNDEITELKSTIKNCQANGVELIIVTSPYYAQYDNSVKEICNEFANMMSDMEVEYVNLLYTEPFASDSSCFRDNAHLNTKGAEMMTDTIIKIMNILKSNKQTINNY